MKPHEETLVIENGAGHCRGDRWLYAGPDREVGFVSEEAPGGAQQWAVLLAAAPEMARAILGLGEVRAGQWHTRECWAASRGCIVECQPLALALVKAGVIQS